MIDNSAEGDIARPKPRPIVKWVIWGFGFCAILMIAISFIGCLNRAHLNKTYYLLACNLIISAFIGSVNAWWFKNGHLSSDKYWYVITLALIIIWQTISTDVYIFSPIPEPPEVTTVTPPLTTTAT